MQELATVMESQAQDFTSFMQVTDDRMTAAIKAIKENHEALHNVSRLMSSISKQAQVQAWVSGYLARKVQMSQFVLQRLNEIEQGIYDLMMGKQIGRAHV
jgi:hypothetical protein